MRACWWCSRPLRAWQLAYCRVCHEYLGGPDPSAPCRRWSRQDDPADRFSWAPFVILAGALMSAAVSIAALTVMVRLVAWVA